MIKMDKFKEIQNLNLSYGDDSENKNVKAKDNVLETPEGITLKSFYTKEDIDILCKAIENCRKIFDSK